MEHTFIGSADSRNVRQRLSGQDRQPMITNNDNTPVKLTQTWLPKNECQTQLDILRMSPEVGPE